MKSAPAIIIFLLALLLVTFVSLNQDHRRMEQQVIAMEQQLTQARTENMEIMRENWRLQLRCVPESPQLK